MNIIDCHSKKGWQISIIFGTNISGTTCHLMARYRTTLPNVCYCTTREKLNQQYMRGNEQKYVHNIPNIIDCNLKQDW